jgi:hypothetical protein
LVLSPTGSINLGFTTEERLVAVLIIPSLGIPNCSVIYINTAPSTPHVEESTGRQDPEILAARESPERGLK